MEKTTRRPLIIKLICIGALLLLLISLNTFSAFAESTNYVAEVNSVKYEKYADAWSAVGNGGTINMLGDWTINKVLTVDENKTVNINMNGYMINRGLTSSTSSGQVFLVKNGATLNINGDENSNIAHKGTIQADMWHYNANGNHTIFGSLITGGYNSNGGGAIHIQKNANVTIKNVTIAGNASSDGAGAGAIRVHGANSKLTVTDSDICYNKATGGGGGAIAIEGNSSNTQIFGTRIMNNTVTYSSGNGGAIRINYGTVSISESSKRVSEISFNNAAKNGGAIYVCVGDLKLKESTIIARNNAENDGGAIYVDWGAGLVEIKGVFAGNSAVQMGGAIYVNSSISEDNGVKISNAEFLSNKTLLQGGAIYVESDNNISLSGKVITNGNAPNSLYIQKSGAIVSNSLTEGSSVGITTSWDASKSSPVKTSNYKYFTSDKLGYEIYGDGSSLYYREAAKTSTDSITVGGETYPVTKGTFLYDPMDGDQVTAYYYYSDGYFAESARYYNEHLATMSTCVAVAAVNAIYEGEYQEWKAAKNIIDLFESAGFKALAIRYPEPEFFGKDSDILSTIGYIIASREITVNGETETLVAIAVRGGKYGAEWASNVTIGDGVGEAYGFKDAADQVESELYKYLSDYEIDTTKAKFWITGFSRAAATSNLVAKRLTDSYGEDDVYAYCFETPKGGVYSLLKDGFDYANIHNILNSTDIVPFVATTEMGFIRYGVDHLLPLYQVGTTEYNKQKEKMLAQLAAVAPDIVFNDRFHEATISYVEFAIADIFIDDAELIDELSYPDYETAAEWNPVFIKKMQEYSLTNNVSNSIYNKNSANWYGYRHYWSTYKWYLYEDDGKLLLKCYENPPSDIDSGKYTVLTIEDSIGILMGFYFGLDDSRAEEIMNAIDFKVIMDNLDLSDFYWDIIGEWNGFSIDEKNKHFNEIWTNTKIEEQLKKVLTKEEIKTLKHAFFVLADFGLDFLSDDYDYTDQNLLGTLFNNMSSILQTHNYEILCAWARSYDSFYANDDLVAPPISPKSSLEGGTYNKDIVVQLTVDNKNIEIYYTLDGTIPNPGTSKKYSPDEPIKLQVIDGKNIKTTIKAISVYNGLVSEVATYNYVLNSNAKIYVGEDIVHVYNFDGSAYLVLAEYDGDILQGIEYYAVTDNYYFSMEDSSLNFENKIVAYLIRDFKHFNPLCDAVCVNDPAAISNNITVNSQNTIEIESFDIRQSENPEFINVTFTTTSNNAEILIVALYEKTAQSDLESIIHFSRLEKSENNTYTFTVERSRIKEILNGGSVNNSSLVLAVTANGVPEINTKETLYVESVYTITYHLNGGTNSIKNPDVFTALTEMVIHNAQREHYIFLGWYDNPECEGTDIWVIPMGTTGNIELYAKWLLMEYTVLYVDGVRDEEIFRNKEFQVKYGGKTPEFGANPTREGYTFVGWDKEISKTVECDVIYSAVWQKNHVHAPVLIEGVEASCSKFGYKSYYECENCGYFEDEECTLQISDVELWKETSGKTVAEHSFTDKIQDKKYLVVGTGINCLDALRYYYACSNCDAVGTEEWISDSFGEHNIDTGFTTSGEQHYHVCLQEGCDYVTEKINCYGGVATCKEKASCTVCGEKYGNLAPHIPCEDDGDCTTAVVCSVCGVETTSALAEHKDEDADGKCDACGHVMNVSSDTEPDTDTDTETETETESEIVTETYSENETTLETDTEKLTEIETESESESESESYSDDVVTEAQSEETNTEAENESETVTASGKKGCSGSLSGAAILIISFGIAVAMICGKRKIREI